MSFAFLITYSKEALAPLLGSSGFAVPAAAGGRLFCTASLSDFLTSPGPPLQAVTLATNSAKQQTVAIFCNVFM
jgi:hypothetical protein